MTRHFIGSADEFGMKNVSVGSQIRVFKQFLTIISFKDQSDDVHSGPFFIADHVMSRKRGCWGASTQTSE
jgi:hypothetical protein